MIRCRGIRLVKCDVKLCSNLEGGAAIARKIKKVIAVGDFHGPWQSRRTVRAVIQAIGEEKPDVIVQMGDLYDLFSFTRFPRTYNIYPPEQELKLGRQAAEQFWASAKRASPKAKCFQLWGNHDDRAVKRALDKAPELEYFAKLGMASLMNFDGVELVADSREELIIDGVAYMHGYRLGLGAHARFNLCRSVTAHTHYGCVIPVKLEKQIIWELNVGYVGDRFAVPMSHAMQRRFSRWTTGYGKVDDKGPIFRPLNTEERSKR